MRRSAETKVLHSFFRLLSPSSFDLRYTMLLIIMGLFFCRVGQGFGRVD